MRKALLVRALFTTALTLPLKLMAADVADGSWSDYHKIEQMKSVWSYSSYKVNSPAGCGGLGDQWWKLPMHNNDANLDKVLQYKRATLLAAFMSGREVKFRCEGGSVIDLIVK